MHKTNHINGGIKNNVYKDEYSKIDMKKQIKRMYPQTNNVLLFFNSCLSQQTTAVLTSHS